MIKTRAATARMVGFVAKKSREWHVAELLNDATASNRPDERTALLLTAIRKGKAGTLSLERITYCLTMLGRSETKRIATFRETAIRNQGKAEKLHQVNCNTKMRKNQGEK